MEILNKLVKDLVDHGWTMKGIAERLGIHKATLHRWLNGSRIPSSEPAVTHFLAFILTEKPPSRHSSGRPFHERTGETDHLARLSGAIGGDK